MMEVSEALMAGRMLEMPQYFARVVLNRARGDSYRDLHTHLLRMGFFDSFTHGDFTYELPDGIYFTHQDITLKQAIAKARKAIRESYFRIGSKSWKRKVDSASVVVVEAENFEWSGLKRKRMRKSAPAAHSPTD